MKDGVTVTGLHWQGRTFDVAIGAEHTTVTQTAGVPFSIESPEGTRTVSLGTPLTLRTRRPDLVATDNAARCAPSRATSEEPGLYAEAAVDGNRATAWAPDAPRAASPPISGGPRGSRGSASSGASRRPRPSSSSSRRTATAGRRSVRGELPPPTVARYVRVFVQAASADGRTGIRELEVIAR